jgi:hypothetical protein
MFVLLPIDNGSRTFLLLSAIQDQSREKAKNMRRARRLRSGNGDKEKDKTSRQVVPPYARNVLTPSF